MTTPIRGIAASIAIALIAVLPLAGQNGAKTAVVTPPVWSIDREGEFVTIIYALSETASQSYDVELLLANTEQRVSYEPDAVTGHVGTVRAGAQRKIIWHYRKDFPGGLAGRGWKFILNIEWGREKLTVASKEGSFTPPALRFAPVVFTEPGGNGLLDAGETGEIASVLHNDGLGAAAGTQVRVSILSGPAGIRCDTAAAAADIPPGGTVPFRIPISAPTGAPSGPARLLLSAQDRFQYSVCAETVSIQLQAFLPPALEIAYVWIRSAFNPTLRKGSDGIQVVRGDTTELLAQVRNRGRGKAEGVTASLQFAGEGWNVRSLGGSRPSAPREILPDSSIFISFLFLPDEKAEAESVQARLAVQERRTEFGAVGEMRFGARRRYLSFDEHFGELMRRRLFDSAAALCRRQMLIDPARTSISTALASVYDTLGDRTKAMDLYIAASGRGDRTAGAWLSRNTTTTEVTSVRYESTPLPFIDAATTVALGVFPLPPTAVDPKGERLYNTLRSSADLKRLLLIPYRAMVSQLGVSAISPDDTAALALAARALKIVYVVEGRETEPGSGAIMLTVKRAANGQPVFTRRFQASISSQPLDDVARLFRESLVPVYATKRTYKLRPGRSR